MKIVNVHEKHFFKVDKHYDFILCYFSNTKIFLKGYIDINNVITEWLL